MATVKEIQERDSRFVTFVTPKGWQLEAGESILVNGVCSTAINITRESFDVEYMPETLRKTTFEDLHTEQKVNLERSLTPNDLMGGHLLYGHVDTVGEVESIVRDGDAHVLKIRLDPQWTDLIVDKGPIAIDGISLTVVDVGEGWFTISLIAHTIENTNLNELSVGERLNIEIDVNAKYIKKMLKQELYAKKA